MVSELEWLLMLCMRYRTIDEGSTLLVCVDGLVLIIALLKESFTLLGHLNFAACANQCLSTT